jgi:hypothetical protein
LTYASLLGIIFFVEPCTEELTFKACESTMSFEQSYRLQGMACILVHHFEYHGVKYLTWLGLNYADWPSEPSWKGSWSLQADQVKPHTLN